MRQWITVVCVIALLLYVGWVLDHNQSQADHSTRAGISALQHVLTRAGGSLQTARLMLVAPISDPGLPRRVQEELGWVGAAPQGELREARLYTEHGMYYLALHWQMSGERATQWAENHALLGRVLSEAGVSAPVHVQLEGEANRPAQPLLVMAHAALDGVAAAERQPWADERSVSVAGRSGYLPEGPHEVNVQVAARQTEQGVRLWVAWPALTGDY